MTIESVRYPYPSNFPLDIEQLVSTAVREFRKETAFLVEAEVDKMLIERGLKEQAYLQQAYKELKFTKDELSRAIKELLSRARDMALDKGKTILDTATVVEAMERKCTFWPWC